MEIILAIKCRGVEMEVMDIPSKELLIFYNQIDEWVDQVYPDQDRPSLSFKKDTPQSILDLFDSIKSKIGFDSLERKY